MYWCLSVSRCLDQKTYKNKFLLSPRPYTMPYAHETVIWDCRPLKQVCELKKKKTWPQKNKNNIVSLFGKLSYFIFLINGQGSHNLKFWFDKVDARLFVFCTFDLGNLSCPYFHKLSPAQAFCKARFIYAGRKIGFKFLDRIRYNHFR